jgi:hypothetical protein
VTTCLDSLIARTTVEPRGAEKGFFLKFKDHLLTVYAFPQLMQRSIRSTNAFESLVSNIRQRTDQLDAFTRQTSVWAVMQDLRSACPRFRSANRSSAIDLGKQTTSRKDWIGRRWVFAVQLVLSYESHTLRSEQLCSPVLHVSVRSDPVERVYWLATVVI